MFNEDPMDLIDSANAELADILPTVEIAGHMFIDVTTLLDLIAVMHGEAVQALHAGGGERALGFAMPLTILHQGLSLSLARAELEGV